MPEIGTGTIVQNTNYTAKLGYPFEISFTEAAEYSFVEWIAVDKNNPEKRIKDGVSFDDAHSATTKVKISTSSVAVKIIPSCEKRIALAVEPSPRYDPLGVSRDRSITVTFTKSLNKSSFIYEENEIPAGAQTKKNEDEEIWAYTLNGQTYLKNISITNADDYSIAEHFTCPLVNDKLLTIAVDKNEPIKFNSGEVFKTVKVTLSKDICDTKGIKMNTEKSWNYQITESTDDKASVNLTSDKGSVYLAGTKDYSIGQKITLALTEDADYQFVRWDYDSSIIYLAEPTNPNTTATVLEKTQGENTTQIKAICAPRLRVLDKGFSPLNDSENPTVSKNSSIVITFNQNLPDDEEGKKQLENISITIGGSPVNSSFKTPVINENTVTFVADNSNMLDVPAGQTKTVSVTVPADLYYKLADGTKVSYGANGISFNYKIDETTLDKAEITVSAASGSGTLKGASGSGNYSIGQEVSLVFEPADGWQFNGWSVTCGGEAVPETQIKIADKNALSTKLTVYEALAGLLVTAKTSECLSFTANPSAAVNPKDSEIKITFNKNLASDCASLLDKILINSGDLDDYYATRVLEGNTITIKNTSPLSVAKDTTKLITVTVPSDFYYMNDGIKVNLERKSFSFKVDHTTNAKTKVTYSVINGENDSAFNPSNAAGSIEGLQTNLVQYNIGEEVPLSFALADGYQFYGWKITDANGALVTDTVSYKNNTSASSLQPTLVMNKPAEGLKISAVCYKRPSISTSTVTPYNANSAEEVAKNKAIVLNFAHKIMSETKDAIIVNYSAISNFNKNTYFSTSISEDEKTVTLKPIKMLPLNNSYETVTVTVPHDKVYYLASDGKTKITPSDEDFTWSYKINSSTEKQTEVRFATTDAAQIGRQINVGDTLLSSGSKQKLNIEQTVKLEYPIAEPDKYKFAGWKVSPATSGYTVTPSSYVTSGSITVKNESDTYFTLIVDSDDPTKASITSSAFMSNGTDGYGITVSAKDVELPSISTFSPSAAVNPKDSEIKITFNKNLASDCASLLDKILINSGDLDDYYATRELDGNIITIKNTSPLSVAKDTTKLITVTVPSDFYYMNDGIKVNFERKSFSFKVDHTTNAKTKVTYSVINGEGGAVLSAAGSIEDVQSNCQYNIGEEVPLSFVPASGYQFFGWKITDANGNLVTDTVSYKNNTSASSLQPTLVMNKPAEGLKISAVCYKRPKVTTLSPYSSESNKEFAKNTPISLTFAHAIKDGTEQFIEIKYSVSSFSQSTYFSRSLSSDHTKVLFTPIKMLPVENAFETVTVTVPHDKVYYLAADGKTKITTSEDDFSWSYKVNSSTITKTIVGLDTTDANGNSINVNGLAGGTNQTVNVEESLSLVYPLAQDYKFMGWKLTCASSEYTVSPAGYVTSGTITIKNGTKPYFTLTIDSSDSTKATIKSYDAIGNGTGNYGLTIGVKDSLLPKITATGPAYSTGGIDCDTSVTVTFNKAINTSTVTLGSSGTIQIVDPANENEHYESYFNSPSWSGNIVTIKPKYTIQELVSNGSGPKTLKVKFNLSNIKDSDGNSLVSSPEYFTYRINDAMEKDKPEWQGNQYLYDGLNSAGSLSTTAFSNWNSSDYTKNHIKDSVRFSFYGYDKKSGLKALRITETYYKTVSGGTTSNETIIKEYSASQYSSYYETLTDGTPYYRITGYHNLQTVNDGVVKLDFQLLDNAGNESTKKTYYVIKDTVIDESVVKFDETKQNALAGSGLSVYNSVRKRSGDNDTVTLTLSSIPQDIFYGTTYKTAYDISVKYGYSKDSISNNAVKSTPSTGKMRFTFTHLTKQTTFVKITVSDAAGNTKELIRAIPGQAVITSQRTFTDSLMNWDMYEITCANKEQNESLCQYYGASSFMTNTLIMNTTEGNSSWYKGGAKDYVACLGTDSYGNPDFKSPKGKTLKVYAFVGYKYGDSISVGDTQSEYWYSSLSDEYVEIIASTTEDWRVSGSYLRNTATSDLSSNYVIDYLKVTTEPVVNSGCYKVVVSDDFISRIQSEHNVDTTGITYSIIAKNSSGEKIESKDLTFYLPSPGKYELFLKAENSNRQSVTTSSYRYLKINGTGSDREQYLNFTDDLTAPSLNLSSDENYYSTSPAFWYTDYYSAIVSDNGTAGLVTDTSGKVLLDYYFIPNSNSTLSVLASEQHNRYLYLHNTYTLEELERDYSDLKKTIAIAPDATSIQIPFDGLPEGLYTICLVAKDNNGNYTVKCRTAFNKRLRQTLVLSKLYSNTYSYFFRANKRFEVKWLTNGVWTKKGTYANYEGQDPQVEFNKGSLGNWWIKIDAYFENGCSVADSGFYDVTYLNLGYYKQLWEEGAAVMDVSSKNIIPGMNGMQVLCTAPTLAHTMYCSRKLSDGTSAEDIATWENMAMETGIVEKSSNFTYSNDNYSNIPSGYYYTTIVHFADGTTLMTEVKQK